MRNTLFTLYEDEDISIYDLKIKKSQNLPQKPFIKKIDKMIFIVCARGKLQVDVNSRKYTIKTRDILFCRPNVILSNYIISSGFRGIIICLSQKKIVEHIHMDNNIWNKAFYIAENPIIHVGNNGLLEAYGRLITLRLAHEQRPYRRDVISFIVWAGIYEILAEIEVNLEFSGDRTITQADILFRKFLKLVSATKVKSRSVSRYAERLCVSPKYLSTVCKQISGKTACEWINQFVITDIQHLLKYSEKSIKEISEYLNFPNISFFGKYVKTHLGYSPKEYRRIIKDSKA